MARYIDAEKCPEYFNEEYKQLRQLFYQGEVVNSMEAGFVGAERAIHEIPTADVVPKSEVVREIIERITRVMSPDMQASFIPIFGKDSLDYEAGVRAGRYDAIISVLAEVAKIGKEYEEE